jgi:hypothetical protein
VTPAVSVEKVGTRLQSEIRKYQKKSSTGAAAGPVRPHVQLAGTTTTDPHASSKVSLGTFATSSSSLRRTFTQVAA